MIQPATAAFTRENGQVTGIVEHKDASEAQRQIQEINTGILIAGGADLKRWLANLTNNNAQGEYYITDIIAMAHQEGREIVAVHPQRLSEVEGVNNRLQLARAWSASTRLSKRKSCCWRE